MVPTARSPRTGADAGADAPGGAVAGSSSEADQAPVPHGLASLARLVGIYRREFADQLGAEPWATDAGLKPPSYGALTVIALRGPVSQREVCDVIGLHASDLVAIMDRLEANGWVERRRDPTDRRRYRLTLTAEGRRALDRLDAVAARAEATVLEPLAPTERRQLLALVAKVVDRPAPDQP